jgi:hypothetical protein
MNGLVEYLFPLVSLAVDSPPPSASRATNAGDLMNAKPRFVRPAHPAPSFARGWYAFVSWAACIVGVPQTVCVESG